MATIRLYHTSPNQIGKINKEGPFVDCLCFSGRKYKMTHGQVHVYALDIDESDILYLRRLWYLEITKEEKPAVDKTVSRVMQLFDVDEETAQNLLDESENPWDYTDDEEKAWELQGLSGSIAAAVGYRCAVGRDEQGTVYIVPMFERESELIYLGIEK